MTAPGHALSMPAGIDFATPAEVYFGGSNFYRHGLTYKAFPTLAEAICHVMETPRPGGERAVIECGEHRLEHGQIAELYGDQSYPLPRIRIGVTAAGRSHRSDAQASHRRLRPDAARLPPVAAGIPSGHKHRVGDRMRLRPGGYSVARQAAYCRIVSLMPQEKGPPLYRIKSELESFERVVTESELLPV
jgi:hypothetical protein